jgi:hypothetical protein
MPHAQYPSIVNNMLKVYGATNGVANENHQCCKPLNFMLLFAVIRRMLLTSRTTNLCCRYAA